jgi:hypothetical protein
MLATIGIVAVISTIASVLVIAATMLSSRLSSTEEHYLVEDYEAEQSNTDVSGDESPQSIR